LKQHQPNIITTTDEETIFLFCNNGVPLLQKSPTKNTKNLQKKNIKNPKKNRGNHASTKKITGIPIFPSGFSLPIFHPNVVRNFFEFVANFFLKNTNYCSSDPNSPMCF